MAAAMKTLAKAAYGALFVLLLPGLLVVWERLTRPLIELPVYGNELAARLILGGSVLLMVAGMWQLWREGGGLPMNAFPPPRLATGGVFRWIAHPIYAGFTFLCWSVSMLAGSPSGLWLITPMVGLGCAALVIGYESPDLKVRFGNALREPHVVLSVFVPWLILFEATTRLAPRSHVWNAAMAWEDRLPVWAWTEFIYLTTYLAVPLVPFVVKEAGRSRRFAAQGWIAMAVVFPIYWVLPTSASQAAAFPASHALWSILAAEAIGAGRPKVRIALRVWAGLVAVSCVTTGRHCVMDVAAALLVAAAILQYERCWRALLRGTEAIANSWREWRFGPLRIINHGFYAGAGTLVGLCLITAATGPALAGPVLVTVIGGVVGAGLWAQFVEGSPRLLRPFGFYGGLLGVIATCAWFDEVWLLWAAHSLAGPWVQGLGRMRCLVQGCCHGAPAPEAVGIVYRRAESRVTRIAYLGGVPVHATPLYSILWNVFTGLMLLRMWVCGAPLNLICAVWLILNGIGRFAEERYRGEPQTAVIGGLRFYQWLAIVSVLGGVGVSCAWGVGSAPPLVGAQVNLLLGVAGFALTSFALGVDFPSSERRFARLT